jgi:hypothetical protein
MFGHLSLQHYITAHTEHKKSGRSQYTCMGFGAICAAIGSLYFDTRVAGVSSHLQYLPTCRYLLTTPWSAVLWRYGVLGHAFISNIIIFDSGKITIPSRAF